MPIELRPCPFCGLSDLSVDDVGSWQWAVSCAVCETQGPLSGVGMSGAVEVWNQRSGANELAAERKERERLNAEVVRLREALIHLSDLMKSK